MKPESTWPAQFRAALIVLVVVDSPLGDDATTESDPGIDYAASGLQHLLTAFADLDIPATTAWTPPALSVFPQLARSAVEAGHELALASGTDTAEGVDASLTLVRDGPVIGMVESLGVSRHTNGAAANPPSTSSQFRWRVTGLGGDWPLPATLDDLSPSIIVPVSPYWMDRTWLPPDRPLPPSSMLEAWSLALADVRTQGGLMTIVLHPHVSGRPGHLSLVTRFLDEVIATGDTWIATAAQVAGWWLRDLLTDVE